MMKINPFFLLLLSKIIYVPSLPSKPSHGDVDGFKRIPQCENNSLLSVILQNQPRFVLIWDLFQRDHEL